MNAISFKNAAVLDRRSNKWLNRFAWFTAIATLFLICSGGMVTSKNVGLAVPDWPTTFGYNMFFFPFSKWIGGIFFEHIHRLIASTVGFLTIILAVWLWRSEPRRWVRNLGYAALAAVIIQGVLGGLRVTMLKDEIGIFHACLAQAYFATLIVIALVTTNFWDRLSLNPLQSDNVRILVRVSIITAIMIYVQLSLGATMRHQHRDLSILDFPLAYGKIIPDVSAAKARRHQRLARCACLIRCERISNLAATGASLCCSHHRGVCDYVLVSRARTCSPIGFAPKFIELVGLSRRLPNRIRCVDCLE